MEMDRVICGALTTLYDYGITLRERYSKLPDRHDSHVDSLSQVSKVVPGGVCIHENSWVSDVKEQKSCKYEQLTVSYRDGN